MAEVIIGSGFIGRRLGQQLDAERFGSMDCLSADMLRGTVAVFCARSKAQCGGRIPGPTQMIDAFIEVARNAEYIVYLSSDAVYPYTGLITESTPIRPGSPYGTMHSIREAALIESVGDRLLIARLTQVYGPGDPHDTYGPSRMLKQAERGKPLEIFGNGEERRDHIYIDDVADIIAALINTRHVGVVNVATGRSRTFREVADLIAVRWQSRVLSLPRSNEIKHRDVDVALMVGLTGIVPRDLETGFEVYQNE